MSASVRTSERLRDMQLAQQTTRGARTPFAQESPSTQILAPFRVQPKLRKRRKVRYETGELGSAETTVYARPYSRVKGRRGRLEFMSIVPLDVIYEIFGFLEPIDLLHISWANKSLNAIVASKATKFLWERAYQRLSISSHPAPPCPPDLNFAQHTKLLFDKRCMECNSPHGLHVYWLHRLRVCTKCIESDLFTEMTNMNFSRRLLFQEAFPFLQRAINGRFRKFLLTSDYNEASAILNVTSPDFEKWKNYVEQKGNWAELRSMVKSKSSDRLRLIDQLLQNEWDFEAWQLSRERDRDIALEEVREKRRDDIIARLVELDWEDELDHLSASQLYGLPGFGVAKRLTDKEWEALRPGLIGYLGVAKMFRLEDEKFERISDRRGFVWRLLCLWSMIESQFRSDTLPQILDIAIMEPFRSFILEDVDELPGFLMDMRHLSATFKTFADSWNQSREQFLVSLIHGKASQPKWKANARTNTVALKRATTFFQCPYCTEPISFPRILAHGCLLNRSSTKKNRRETDPEILAAFSFHIFPRPWFSEAQNLTFDHEASDTAKSIIKECGENPDRITQEQMDEKDLRLECRRCTGQKKGRYTMKWRMAIMHELEKHPKSSEDIPVPTSRKGRYKKQAPESNWRLVTDSKDLTQVHTKEAKDDSAKPPLECKWCRSVIKDNLMYLEIHFTFCNPYLGTYLGQDFLPGRSRFQPPEEDELRELYRTALDKSIKDYERPIRLSMKTQGTKRGR